MAGVLLPGGVKMEAGDAARIILSNAAADVRGTVAILEQEVDTPDPYIPLLPRQSGPDYLDFTDFILEFPFGGSTESTTDTVEISNRPHPDAWWMYAFTQSHAVWREWGAALPTGTFRVIDSIEVEANTSGGWEPVLDPRDLGGSTYLEAGQQDWPAIRTSKNHLTNPGPFQSGVKVFRRLMDPVVLGSGAVQAPPPVVMTRPGPPFFDPHPPVSGMNGQIGGIVMRHYGDVIDLIGFAHQAGLVQGDGVSDSIVGPLTLQSSYTDEILSDEIYFRKVPVGGNHPTTSNVAYFQDGAWSSATAAVNGTKYRFSADTTDDFFFNPTPSNRAFYMADWLVYVYL